jgi:formyl-CoA transferase/CoA:oxalate CoA-transferase
MLGELGARVIKIESLNRGDDTRGWGPPFLSGESAYFLSVNGNKESLTLNLKAPQGLQVLHQLLARADLLVENFRPGVADRLGFGYDAVHARYPRVIYTSISAFGYHGPYREHPAYDLILQGMGGLMAITGEENGPPVKVGVAVADICAGMFAAFAILAALLARGQTGRGQWIDVSMLDGQIAWLTYQASAYFATGTDPVRMGSAHPTIVPYQAFRTSDGYINVAVGSESIWERFCAAIDHPELAADPRYRTNPDRVAHRIDLIQWLKELFVLHPTGHWRKLLDRASVPNGPVNRLSDLFADQQLASPGMVVEIEHPEAGRIRQIGLPMQFSEIPRVIRRPPPRLGEHTDLILRELGYDTATIARFHQEGVV